MLDWWHNGFIWLSSPEQAALVNGGIWTTIIVSMLYTLWSVANRLRWQHQQARRNVAAASSQARLDVFNSWIMAGGWTTDLSEAVFEENMSRCNKLAARHGPEYLSNYVDAEELAKVELDKVICATIKEMNSLEEE